MSACNAPMSVGAQRSLRTFSVISVVIGVLPFLAAEVIAVIQLGGATAIMIYSICVNVVILMYAIARRVMAMRFKVIDPATLAPVEVGDPNAGAAAAAFAARAKPLLQDERGVHASGSIGYRPPLNAFSPSANLVSSHSPMVNSGMVILEPDRNNNNSNNMNQV